MRESQLIGQDAKNPAKRQGILEHGLDPGPGSPTTKQLHLGPDEEAKDAHVRGKAMTLC